MPRLTTALSQLALVVVIADSIYLLFMFIAFPLLRAKAFPTFFRDAAHDVGVSQKGFTVHWCLGVAGFLPILGCAVASFTQFERTRLPLILACGLMIIFTVASGLYLRGRLGLRHAWRIATYSVLLIVFLLTPHQDPKDIGKPNEASEAIGAPSAPQPQG